MSTWFSFQLRRLANISYRKLFNPVKDESISRGSAFAQLLSAEAEDESNSGSGNTGGEAEVGAGAGASASTGEGTGESTSGSRTHEEGASDDGLNIEF